LATGVEYWTHAQREEEADTGSTSRSGVIGLVAGGGLGFAVAAVVCAAADNEDVADFGPIVYGIPAGLLGGTTGAVIGFIKGDK
jgi:hypothetical protein